MNTYYLMVTIIICMLSFLLTMDHYLSLIISLEIIMVNMLVLSLYNTDYTELNSIFLFLAMMVMESAFLVTLMVVNTNSFGKDMYKW